MTVEYFGEASAPRSGVGLNELLGRTFCSRGSPEQVIDGWRHFGYIPGRGETDADMARRHAEVFLEFLKGEGFARPNP